MSRVAYVNGRYVPHAQAQVHVEDRGYQFADGVYEVMAVRGGVLVDLEAHNDRLERSLRELQIPMPMSRIALTHVMRETVRRNRVIDGIIYLQVTRGVARRDHPFPKAAIEPALVLTARNAAPQPRTQLEDGIAVKTMPDIRWDRCDIKSIALLPNVLAKQAARAAGAYEAWMVDAQGNVTEGGSTNAWIVDGDGNLVTRPLDNGILSGVTRLMVIELARKDGIKVVERPFSVAEAKRAREAMLSSTTAFVTPITRIDDATVGNGKPGSMAQRLRGLYQAHVARQVDAARAARERAA
jgi:D-alanine transaminase